MSKAIAIRNIETRPDGTIGVQYTYGSPPLTSQVTGGQPYGSQDELKRRIGDIELLLGEEGLMLLHLAITYLRQDGGFNNVNQVYNKTLTLDPYAANPLRVT